MNPAANNIASALASHTSGFFFQFSKRPFLLAALLVLMQSTDAQILAKPVLQQQLPASIDYKGNYFDAYWWKDADREHFLLRTISDPTPTPGHTADEGLYDQALYAYHFIVHKDSLQLTWKVQDFLKECEFDKTIEFLKNTFAVTDLDKNNKAEVWLMYQIACRSDVSPADLKIIMYEDSKKFAARGSTKIKVSATDYIGGDMSFDEAFKKASPLLKNYAAQLWDKNVLETWDQ